MLLSDVSVAYIRPKSRTERPRKTKIVTRDSDTTFKVKGQLVADVLNSQHVGTGATLRINTKILSTCRGRRHIMAATHFFLVIIDDQAYTWPFSVYSKTCFWLWYCQISTDLDKILHTYCCTEYTCGPTWPWSARGWFQAKPEWLFFVTHPKSYTETTDRRNFGESGGVDGCYREKLWNFVAWVKPDPIVFLAFYAQPTGNSLPQTSGTDGSEGVPFASLESVTRHLGDIGPWRVPQVVTSPSQKLKICI